MLNQRSSALWRVGLLALSGLIATVAPGQDSPEQVLQRWFERSQRISVTLVQLQRLPVMGTELVQVKIESDGKGRRRYTILQPLRLQGVVSIDDGRNLTTIKPDSGEMLVQPSPSSMKLSSRDRLALIRRNYDLRFGESDPIAGRRVTVVIASPRAGDLPTRRFSLDAESSLLLRTEQIGLKGEVFVSLDTRMICYDKVPDNGQFDPPRPGASVRVIRATEPQRPDDPTTMRKRLGFSPRMPDPLPMGFRIEEMHVIGDREPMAALRLTDGLVVATVYQWRSDREATLPGLRGRDERGIWYAVMGDLSNPAARRILQAFTRQ